MELLLVLIICIAILVLYWFIAKWFFEIAKDKGYNNKKYFWICFWLSYIGYLLIIAMPDRGGNQLIADDELPDL